MIFIEESSSTTMFFSDNAQQSNYHFDSDFYDNDDCEWYWSKLCLLHHDFLSEEWIDLPSASC